MTRSRGKSGLVLAVLLVVALASGCPLQPQDRPVPIPDLTSVAAGPTSTPPSARRAVMVFLIRQDRLIPVVREVEPGPDDLTTSLQALVRPADTGERARKLRSALPPGIGPPVWRAEPDRLRVELPDDVDGLRTLDQVLAIGQLVYTVTQNVPVDRVVFVRRDADVAVPDGTGRLLARAVTRQDYMAIAPG